jgi:antitoxin (DNA-binding transcriptional repressor) of toxin-antitoxin stability system
MKTLTIREAREGLSHPEQMFANNDEVLVVCRGEPVARILPVTPKRKTRSMAACIGMVTAPSTGKARNLADFDPASLLNKKK